MNFPPVIRALSRHKIRVCLFVAQIAVTMAIVSNALFIINGNFVRINRPSGVQEDVLFLISQSRLDLGQSDGPSDTSKQKAMMLEDISALRSSPYIESVSVVNTLPLTGTNFSSGGVALKMNQKKPTADVSYYYGDESMIETLGLRLIAGRPFARIDIGYRTSASEDGAYSIIITNALAKALFPGANALGKQVYLDGNTPSTIVGIVETLQAASVAGWARGFAWNSVIIPEIKVDSYTSYAVRSKPSQLGRAMKDARDRLYAVNRMRILDDQSVKSFSDIRDAAYRQDYGVAVVMVVICIIVLTITGGGILGVSSCWVAQRRRQIGIRRSLGARKMDIALYFVYENIVVTSVGVLFGLLSSLALHGYLRQGFEMDALRFPFLANAAVIVFCVSLIGVTVPAWRGSRVSPMVATRNI